MKPAAAGTGVIAGGAARIILEEAGVHDVLCKSLGSANPINVARATIAGLKSLQRPDEVAKRRGLAAEDFVPKGMLNAYNERQRGGRATRPTEVRADERASRSPRSSLASRQAEDPRHAARARTRSHRQDQHPARPPRDPGHDRSCAAPRRVEVTEGSTDDAHPRSLAGPRARPRAQARRPRYRRQGRQDRRSRHQGPARPQHGPPRLRRWPDATQAARPEAEGLQQPVPRRVPAVNLDTLGELAGQIGHDHRPGNRSSTTVSCARAPTSRCSPEAS